MCGRLYIRVGRSGNVGEGQRKSRGKKLGNQRQIIKDVERMKKKDIKEREMGVRHIMMLGG